MVNLLLFVTAVDTILPSGVNTKEKTPRLTIITLHLWGQCQLQQVLVLQVNTELSHTAIAAFNERK